MLALLGHSRVARALPRDVLLSLSVRHVAFNAKAFMPNERGPNIHIIRWLMQEMEKEVHSSAENGPYKARALQRACKAIDALPEAVTSGDEAKKIVGVGAGIARRIDEYLSTGSEGPSSQAPALTQATSEDTERQKILAEIRRVPGIGSVTAQKLYDAGCRSLEDLHKPEHSKRLSSTMRVGLDYVGHLDERATRIEIEAVMKTIQPILSSEIKMYAVGSYRRGLLTCGDVDIIIFHPSCTYVPHPGEKMAPSEPVSSEPKNRRGRPRKHVTPSRAKQDTLLRETVLGPLERAGVIAATLSEGSRKWQGMARIPTEDGHPNSTERGNGSTCAYRRMDLSLYPNLSEGAALLATTGDADFNAHVRRCASKMGLLLNEYGLWKFCRHSPATRSTYENGVSYTKDEGRWELVASTTEQGILDELGVEFVAPERRNFAFVVSKSKQGSMLKIRKDLRRGKPK